MRKSLRLDLDKRPCNKLCVGRIIFLLLLCILTTAQAFVQHQHQPEPQQDLPPSKQETAQRPPVSPATSAKEIILNGRKEIIPDAWLIDQDGKRVHFYDDMIKGKTVALGFFYSTCTYICTRHGELFSKLQTELKNRLGKDVFLISVSMDPQTDTPEKLARWGRTYRRKPGWTLLTGSAEEVSKVLKVFTGNTAGPRDEHSSFFYIANDETGNWNHLYAPMRPSAVVKKIDELAHPPEIKRSEFRYAEAGALVMQ